MNETPTALQPPSEGTTPKTLAQKIAEITATVEKVKRTGKNKDQGYDYVTIEDVVDATRRLMAERHLVLTASLTKMERITHTKGYIVDVTFEWTLEDAETGEKKTWTIPGSGWDYNDKAVFKAMTGSRKYATIIIFNLPIGDNPEAPAGADRGVAAAAARDIAKQKIAQAAGKGSPTAIDALFEMEPEKKINISRPEQFHGHYIIVTGMIDVPQLAAFFDDTDSKRFKTKMDLVPYRKVSSDYEKGLLELCKRLGIAIEGLNADT